MMDRFGGKRVVLIAVAFIIAIVVGIVMIFLPKDNNEPTKTTVEPGETITEQQIEERNQNNNSNSGGTGSSGSGQGTGSTAQPKPTKDEFYDIIVKSGSVAPNSKGQVSFGILRVQNPTPGWYIVTIRSGNLEPAKVIFHQTNDPNNPLTIVAGPGTYFPDSLPIPSAVRRAL